MCQVSPQQIDVILETPDFLVLNKPVRIHFDETITQCSKIQLPDDWEAVHRLDFETSGCLLVAPKSKAATLRELFKGRAVKKLYLAGASRELGIEVVDRTLDGYIMSRYRSSKKVKFIDASHVEDPGALRRKNHAVQSVKHHVKNGNAEETKIAREKLGFSGVIYEIDLISGARHQIRAFFASADAAINGDPIYGANPEPETRLELHAYKLEFENPFQAGSLVSVTCP